LEGVDRGKTREFDNVLMPLWIVFHGAAAERVKTCVYSIIKLAESGEIPDDFNLTYLR
jgi:hypothetical protein